MSKNNLWALVPCSQYFGSAAQPDKPVRIALQVAAPPMAGGFVEIAMTAAKAPSATN